MKFSDYLADFRAGWKPLLAASLGLGSGMALLPFVMNILAPHIVSAMGWSKADFALAAMASGLTILSYPVAGRLADRFGVRPVAFVGVLSLAAGYVAIAALDGPVSRYVGIMVLQLSLGAMISGPVLLRLIVRSFDRSRGMALAIAITSPAVIAVLGSPLLTVLIERSGWRVGSLATAAFVLAAGLFALMLVPGRKETAPPALNHARSSAPRVPSQSLRSLLSERGFLLLIMITLLVSMPLVLTNSQLALVLVDNGLPVEAAGSVIAFFAAGTIAGRLLAGAALDRFAAEFVGAIALSLPAIGMLLLASPFDHVVILIIGVLVIGLAFGAEGDVLAFIAARLFDVDTYGTALGIVFGTAGASAMLGSLILSQSLRLWGGYSVFLVFGSASVLIGSALLLTLRKPSYAAAGDYTAER